MSNLYQEADLPADDRPVTHPRPVTVPKESGRRRFGSTPEEQAFKNAGRWRALKYNITEDRFWEMMREQGSACAICGAEFKAGGRRMAIDHNHLTGEVRGILCTKCNLGLGTLQDSPYILRAAVKYLAERGHYGPDLPLVE